MSNKPSLYLRDITVDKLGSVTDKSLKGLSPALNIVYGPNEAGKSTLRDAILFGLYGLPGKLGAGAVEKSKYENRSTYYFSDSPLRQITGVISENDKDYHFTQSSPAGKASVLSFPDADGEAVVARMREDISFDEYATVWNISGYDLKTINPGWSSKEVGRSSALTVFATAVDPYDVQESLKKRLEDQYKGNKANPEGNLKKTIIRLSSLETERRRLEALSQEGTAALAEMVDLEEQERLLAPQEEEHNEAAISASTDEANLEAHELTRQRLEKRAALLEHQIDEISDELKQVRANDYSLIILQEPQITKVHAQESDIASSRTQLEAKAFEISEKGAEIQQYDELPEILNAPDFAHLEDQTGELGQSLISCEDALSRSRQELEALIESRTALEAGDNDIAGELPEKRPTLSFSAGGILLTVLSLLGVGLSVLEVFGENGSLLTGIFSIVLFALGVLMIALPNRRMRTTVSGSDDNGAAVELAGLKNREAQVVRVLKHQEIARRDAQKAWASHIEKYLPGLSEEATPGEAKALIKKIQTKSLLTTQLSALTRSHSALEAKVLSWQAAVDEIYHVLGHTNYIKAPARGVQPLMSALGAAFEDSRLDKSLSEKLTTLKTEQENLESELLELDGRFKMIYSRYPGSSDYKTCIEKILARAAALKMNAQLLKEESTETTRALTRLQGEIDAISSSEELQKVLDEIALVKARIENLYSIYLLDLLSSKLLENATQAYFDEYAPKFEEHASDVFRRITDGRYTKIEVSDTEKGQRLSVICGEDGRALAPHELSRGTADQLYIALRIGLLLAYSSNGKSLPVVLDDILSTSDATRVKRAMEELLLLAQKRQVIFFTFDETIAEDLAMAAADKNVNYKEHSLL